MLRLPQENCIARSRDAHAQTAREQQVGTASTLRGHLEEHAEGRLTGDIPADWLEDNGLGQCVVWSCLLARRFERVCPRCRPALARAPTQLIGRQLPEGYPSIEAAFEEPIAVKSYVPKGAQQLWSQCLLTALAAVTLYSDERAWVELLLLLLLPKMVLKAF